MSVFAVIIDQRPHFVSENSPQSCVTLPVGGKRWLAGLSEMLVSCGAVEVFVIPAPGNYPGYDLEIQAIGTNVQILSRESLRGFARRCEAADQLLIYDSRYFSTSRIDLSTLVSGPSSMPRHLVRMVGSETGTREKLVLDKSQSVLRVQRLYDGRTHLQSKGIICSILNAAIAARLRPGHLTDLSRLHSVLVQYGIPSHDHFVSGRACDLCDARQFLALCENMHQGGDDIDKSCKIDSTACIVGPVIINSGATVEAGAVLVGPALIDTGAVIQQGAIVANSVVLADSRVAAGSFLHDCILSGDTAFDASGTKYNGTHSDDADVARLDRNLGPTPAYQRWKTAMDCSLTVAGLVIISPLLLITALLVRLGSRGPTLYGDEREGRGGKSFRCLKFRTMVNNAHRQQRALYKHNRVDGPQFKLDDDPRITRIGKYLRILNIDELPQLFNVLRGQMSLVGPRPSPFRENQVCVAWRNARLSVPPGISGLWQICRNNRDESDFHQWIHYDLLYVRNASLWLDIKILLATVLTLGGKWSVPVEWIIPSRIRPGSDADIRIDQDPSIARHYLQSVARGSKAPSPKAAPLAAKCAV